MPTMCIHGFSLDAVCLKCEAGYQVNIGAPPPTTSIPDATIAPDANPPARQASDFLEPDALVAGNLADQIELSKAISLRRIADELTGYESNYGIASIIRGLRR